MAPKKEPGNENMEALSIKAGRRTATKETHCRGTQKKHLAEKYKRIYCTLHFASRVLIGEKEYYPDGREGEKKQTRESRRDGERTKAKRNKAKAKLFLQCGSLCIIGSRGTKKKTEKEEKKSAKRMNPPHLLLSFFTVPVAE